MVDALHNDAVPVDDHNCRYARDTVPRKCRRILVVEGREADSLFFEQGLDLVWVLVNHAHQCQITLAVLLN